MHVCPADVPGFRLRGASASEQHVCCKPELASIVADAADSNDDEVCWLLFRPILARVPGSKNPRSVYGTDVPRYVTDLKVEKAGDGQYRIHGQVTQQGVPKDFRTLVPVEVEFGRNDTVRIGSLGMMGEATVPIDVTLKLPKEPKRAMVNSLGEILARD